MTTPPHLLRRTFIILYSTFLLALAPMSVANDFPTVDRALFIQECMALQHSYKYETLYACACTLDNIAAQMSHSEFVEADSYVRMRNMRGERGGLFRSSDQAREIRSRFYAIKDEAEAACFPRQPLGDPA